jgi:hypothetical protein
MTANLRNATKEKREVPMKRYLRNFVACFALLIDGRSGGCPIWRSTARHLSDGETTLVCAA